MIALIKMKRTALDVMMVTFVLVNVKLIFKLYCLQKKKKKIKLYCRS
jgi:hypothetical protein